MNKGEHQFKIIKIQPPRPWWNKYCIDKQCACGKKDWDYAEALSKEEAELLNLQTLENAQRQKVGGVKLTNH